MRERRPERGREREKREVTGTDGRMSIARGKILRKRSPWQDTAGDQEAPAL